MGRNPEHIHRTFGSSGNVAFSYRTTERDKAPAREVLTPILMGDPAPGRVMPNQATGERRYGLQVGFLKDGRRHTHSGPILLTFKEYNEYYGEGR